MSDTPEYKNVGTVLVLYTVAPALNAEGDDSQFEQIEYVKEAFINGNAAYFGFTFPETPERLKPAAEFLGTAVYFTAELAGATPFNSDKDFRAGILTALIDGECTITAGEFYPGSTTLATVFISLKNIIA